MIEICLNPDNETVGGEVFENLDGDLGWVVFDKLRFFPETLVRDNKQGYLIKEN